MKNKLVILSIVLILITISLCGCTDQKAAETKTFEKVNFNSNVLELVDSEVETQIDQDKIISVKATLYFKNLLNHIINVSYIINFCDINDNVLYSKQYEIINIPRNYVFYSPDVFTYGGEDAYLFDHINIKIEDYKVIG